jgi:hypothetical protein
MVCANGVVFGAKIGVIFFDQGALRWLDLC